MAREFFTEREQTRIKSAIQEAELNTSGEIRLFMESKCKGELLDRAAFIFSKLNMHKTQLRNGVLFYLATEDKKFAILGDAGINEKVSEHFWTDVKNLVLAGFKQGNYASSLSEGILLAGEKLKEFFPYQSDGVNELPDDIAFGE